MFEILLERSAERDLDRLPSRIFDRAIASIQSLKNNPRPHGCRKLSGTKSDWRIRVGDYRVIYEINDHAKAVRIMKVRHRREVYR